MKRTVITILVLVGAGGLIALMGYHPKSGTVGAAPGTSTPSVAGTSTVVPATDTPQSVAAGTASASAYRNGTFTGSAVDNAYGTVQVQAVVQGGKLVQVNLLQMPNDRQTSRMITEQAGPLLQQEAISAQSASVDTVSGATSDSESFVESLGAALNQAKA